MDRMRMCIDGYSGRRVMGEWIATHRSARVDIWWKTSLITITQGGISIHRSTYTCIIFTHDIATWSLMHRGARGGIL